MFSSFGKIVAPTLRAIKVGKKRKRWQNDLNTTVKQLFIDKVMHNTLKLQLDSKDVVIICKGQYPGNLFYNIKDLTLAYFQEQYAFPSNFLERFINLEVLKIHYSSFETILPWEGAKMPTKIEELWLGALSQLKYIWGYECQLDSLAQNLKSLVIADCSSLKSLAPSSISLHNLTFLSVYQCHGPVNLVTSSTARSFVQLTAMRIQSCKMIEEIVAIEEDEPEDELSFKCLVSLELTNLESLKSFCSKNFTFNFPSLERVIVKNCPKMDAFCPGVLITPMLKVVETEDEEGDAWEDSLNITIHHLSVQMVAFHSFKHLKLSEFPELKDLWYGQLQNNVFNHLKSVAVHECDFLSDVLFTSNLLRLVQNLEELEVKECRSIEAVFDVKGIMDKEVQVKQTTQWKKLTLSGLPKLKQIWTTGTSEKLSFRSSGDVKVVGCESLENMFLVSLCQDHCCKRRRT